jgi:hypothetical protein
MLHGCELDLDFRVIFRQIYTNCVGSFMQKLFEKVCCLLGGRLLVNHQASTHQLDGFAQDVWTIHLLLR